MEWGWIEVKPFLTPGVRRTQLKAVALKAKHYSVLNNFIFLLISLMLFSFVLPISLNPGIDSDMTRTFVMIPFMIDNVFVEKFLNSWMFAFIDVIPSCTPSELDFKSFVISANSVTPPTTSFMPWFISCMGGFNSSIHGKEVCLLCNLINYKNDIADS
jgi:hypothetical protein